MALADTIRLMTLGLDRPAQEQVKTVVEAKLTVLGVEESAGFDAFDDAEDQLLPPAATIHLIDFINNIVDADDLTEPTDPEESGTIAQLHYDRLKAEYDAAVAKSAADIIILRKVAGSLGFVASESSA